MTGRPENLANPIWQALQTKHRHFAVVAGDACRYPAEVAPFAAVAEPSVSAFEQLHSLLVPGEAVWLVDSFPHGTEILVETSLAGLQMVLSDEVTPPSASQVEIEPLSCSNAQEMVALTDIAFPGFFRVKTCEMGSYYGVRSKGELVAMGGERLMLDGYSEISGVCTLPAHRGKAYAASLMWQLVRDHRRDGIVSWLHVGAENRRAVELYLRMGFAVTREVMFHRIARRD